MGRHGPFARDVVRPFRSSFDMRDDIEDPFLFRTTKFTPVETGVSGASERERASSVQSSLVRILCMYWQSIALWCI